MNTGGTQATQGGYAQTLTGRRRQFRDLGLQATTREGAAAIARAQREAVNAPIQGTAADIIKQAMLEVGPALQAAGLDARLLLQVHDELVFECPANEAAATARVVREVMEGAGGLDIPVRAEVRWGPNWEQMTQSIEQ